ncbi:MAG: AraC family transcriptional regulator [Dysgonamonadaceae bacterium]|jgi:hypothetical protein|nr:AraC family transcriptional regulator [Dysgonamonadaceae bacterium]
MQIDNITVCEPIEKLINLLLNHGFVITETNISDYHFHELYVKMNGESCDNIIDIKVDGISRKDEHTFLCTCHWSTVKIASEETMP